MGLYYEYLVSLWLFTILQILMILIVTIIYHLFIIIGILVMVILVILVTNIYIYTYITINIYLYLLIYQVPSIVLIIHILPGAWFTARVFWYFLKSLYDDLHVYLLVFAGLLKQSSSCLVRKCG